MACNNRWVIASEEAPVRGDAQRDDGRGGDISDPLVDRGVGAITGYHGTDRCGHHHSEPVPDTATGAKIRHTRPRRGQPRSGFVRGDSWCVGHRRD